MLKSTLAKIESALANPHLRIVILAFAALACTLAGVADAKQAGVLQYLSIILGAVAAAQGYHLGKQAEGTVPDGSQPANSGVSINVGTAAETVAEAAQEVTAAQELAGQLRQSAANPAALPPQAIGAVAAAAQAVVSAAKTLALPLLLCVFMLGCAANAAPRTNLHLAAQTLDQAVQDLTRLKTAHVILPGSQLDQDIAAAIHAGDAALHTYRTDIDNPSQAQRDADTFWAAYAKLEPLIAQALTKGK